MRPSILAFTAALPLAAATVVPLRLHAQGTDATGFFSGELVREPRRFAPHLWQSGEEVFGGTFSGDGREYWFFRKVGNEQYRLAVSRFRDGGWSAPERVAFSDTTSDLYPAPAHDGRRVVFTSYRRLPGDTAARGNAYLWEVRREADGWGTPRPLTALHTPRAYHPGPRLLRDGTLYWRAIGRSDRATYRAPFSNDAHGAPERVTQLDALQGERRRVWGAEPSADGRMFALTIATRDSSAGNFGPADIYLVRVHDDGSWEEPRRLGSRVNTTANEGAVGFSPDGRWLFFSRGREILYLSVEAALEP